MKESSGSQNSLLWKFTGEKFWMCEPPVPNVIQASEMIGKMIDWSKANKAKDYITASGLKDEITKLVHEFFPEWDNKELYERYRKKYKTPYGKNDNGKKTEKPIKTDTVKTDTPIIKTEKPRKIKDIIADQKIKTDKKPVKTDTKKVVGIPKAVIKTDENLVSEIINRINAGQKNLFLSGPAGSGKTVTCNLVAEKLCVPIVVLSCNAGTSPAEITGFKYPEPRHSAVTHALPIEGIIVFDEITTLDPSVCANALLANNRILSSMGEIIRHEGCIIIATSNLLGNGRDRQYIANNQLDSATMDRFIGGIIRVDYSTEYESQYDSECIEYVNKLRKIVKENGLRVIVSTRMLQACNRFKEMNMNWKSIVIESWTNEEKKLVC